MSEINSSNRLIEEGEFHIPSELHEMEYWICYRLEEDDDGKIKKVPKDPEKPAHIRNCDATDLDNGVTISEAMDAVNRSQMMHGDEGFDGVGFQILKENDITGVDIDDVIDEDGIMEEWAHKILMSMKSFSEVSPSRTGAHVLTYGELDDKYKNKNNEKGLEMYEENRFFTVTGRWIRGTPKEIKSCPDGILKAWQATHMDRKSDDSSNSTGGGESDAEWADLDTSGHPGVLDYEDLTDREQKVIDAALEHAPDEFRKLYNNAQWCWNYNTKWEGGDKSRCDAALINKLCFWGITADMFGFELSDDEIERLFMSADIADRSKSRNRPGYVRYTVEKYTAKHRE